MAEEFHWKEFDAGQRICEPTSTITNHIAVCPLIDHSGKHRALAPSKVCLVLSPGMKVWKKAVSLRMGAHTHTQLPFLNTVITMTVTTKHAFSCSP